MEIRESLNRGAGRGPGVPFPKGMSGNPAGRPPKLANVLKVRRASVHEMVRAGALAAVRIEVEGGVVEVTALEAAVREVALQAAAGDRLALVTLSRLMASTERHAPAREEPGFTTPEVATAEAYKHAWTAVLRVANGRDTGLPMPVPHPDEIAIDRASALVGFTKGPPAERLSLEPLVAAYHALRAALRERLGELELPAGERPAATRDWHAVADTVDEMDRQLRRRYRRRPMLPEIDTEAMDLAEALAAHADRAALFEEAAAVEAPEDAAHEGGAVEPATAPADVAEDAASGAQTADLPQLPQADTLADERNIMRTRVSQQTEACVRQVNRDELAYAIYSGLRRWRFNQRRDIFKPVSVRNPLAVGVACKAVAESLCIFEILDPADGRRLGVEDLVQLFAPAVEAFPGAIGKLWQSGVKQRGDEAHAAAANLITDALDPYEVLSQTSLGQFIPVRFPAVITAPHALLPSWP